MRASWKARKLGSYKTYMLGCQDAIRIENRVVDNPTNLKEFFVIGLSNLTASKPPGLPASQHFSLPAFRPPSLPPSCLFRSVSVKL